MVTVRTPTARQSVMVSNAEHELLRIVPQSSLLLNLLIFLILLETHFFPKKPLSHFTPVVTT